MARLADELRTPKERGYGLATLIFGSLLWIPIAFGVLAGLGSDDPQIAGVVWVYVGYGLAIWFGVWVAGVLYRAAAYGNMILLGPEQFPELHAMVEAGARDLGLSPTPKAFLFNSNGLFNAFARRLWGGRYVFLTSALVDASRDEQVKFVIGHELGHHAAGHLNGWFAFLRFPAFLIPFLQPAYSRAREYTCDRIGAKVSGDLPASRSALQMLGCGCGRLNGRLNCEAFEGQERLVPPIAGFIGEICRSHPRLTRRVAALKAMRF